MDPLLTTTGGTYKDGKIVLDRPMPWAEGTRVVVQLLEEGGGQIEGVWPADSSESGNAEILRRMEESEKEQASPEEAEEFAAILAEMKESCRPRWPKPPDVEP